MTNEQFKESLVLAIPVPEARTSFTQDLLMWITQCVIGEDQDIENTKKVAPPGLETVTVLVAKNANLIKAYQREKAKEVLCG